VLGDLSHMIFILSAPPPNSAKTPAAQGEVLLHRPAWTAMGRGLKKFFDNFPDRSGAGRTDFRQGVMLWCGTPRVLFTVIIWSRACLYKTATGMWSWF